MPNLIYVLRETEESLTKDVSKEQATNTQTEEERRAEIQRALKGGIGSDVRGMEWGTCMVFSCKEDCCKEDDSKAEAKDCWAEELVLVQWEE